MLERLGWAKESLLLLAGVSEHAASCSWVLGAENTGHPQNRQLLKNKQTNKQMKKSANHAALTVVHVCILTYALFFRFLQLK